MPTNSKKEPARVPARATGGTRKTTTPPQRGGSSRPQARKRRPGSAWYRRLGYPTIGLIILVVVGVVVAIAVTSSGSSSSGAQAHQPAINYTLANGTKVYGGLGPEGVPLQLGPQLAAASTGLTGSPIDGIQCNSSEQLVYHHHVHLALFVNGKPYSVPLGIGMVPQVQVSQTPKGQFADGSSTCLYWTHVHAQDGIIHIESPEARAFELGQIFDIWHVALSPTQLGTYSGTVTATVNGVPWTAAPQQIPLNEHDQIVLNLGGPAVSPPPISWSGTGL